MEWDRERERERDETEEQVIFILVVLCYAAVAINAMITSRSVVTPLGTKTYRALAPQYLVKVEASRVMMVIFFFCFTTASIFGL